MSYPYPSAQPQSQTAYPAQYPGTFPPPKRTDSSVSTVYSASSSTSNSTYYLPSGQSSADMFPLPMHHQRASYPNIGSFDSGNRFSQVELHKDEPKPWYSWDSVMNVVKDGWEGFTATATSVISKTKDYIEPNEKKMSRTNSGDKLV